MVTYTIKTCDGRQHCETYPTLEAAVEGLRCAMGWDKLVLSDSYTAAETSEGYEAYPSSDALEAAGKDGDPYAPRIIKEDD